ncbi:MAG: hypothetical protein VKP70_09905 [Cyanobacteriota bacterium]|nr:hypothetical protein [Cyanobacteriota bacterium]
MSGHLLLRLVDHAKPFKGTWQIYRESDNLFSACHCPSTSGQESEPPSCQTFTSNQQVCRFTALLQFYGWTIEGQTPESVRFRQVCSL